MNEVNVEKLYNKQHCKAYEYSHFFDRMARMYPTWVAAQNAGIDDLTNLYSQDFIKPVQAREIWISEFPECKQKSKIINKMYQMYIEMILKKQAFEDAGGTYERQRSSSD